MRTCFVNKQHRAIADLVNIHSGEFLLTRVNVPVEHRRKGIGTYLLKQVISEADKHRVKLWVEVVPSDGPTFTQLVRWYEKHGFIKYGGVGNITYVRYPR